MMTEFDNLCAALSEVAGCAKPRAATNDAGASAVAFSLDGFEITLGLDPGRSTTCFFVLVLFGPLPTERRAEAAIALLRTNSLMLRQDAPQFGCDPVTGDVLLQHTRALHGTSAVDLYQSIVRFVAIAKRWRATYFLDERGSSAATGPLANGFV